MEEDKVVIEKCKEGDLRSQEILFKKYYGFAKAVSLRYSRSEDDALEICNDGFMKVFSKINSLQDHKM